MEINKASSKEGLKWKCKQHPKYPCDLICLDGDVKDRVMCLNCAQKQFIPLSNLISMSLILSANEHDILEAYPPLKDYELSEKLMKASLQQQLEEIEIYFKKLREDIEKELQASQQRAKEALIKQGKENQELLERYRSIAEIEKLKKLIVSEKESAEKDLDNFIKGKWSKAEENSKAMRNLMNSYESKYNFSTYEPNRIAQETIERLKFINFFQEFTTERINLIKSTFGDTQSMEITKFDDSTYQLKQAANSYSQVFLDPVLDPQKKYILIIELEIKTGSSHFSFGLTKNEIKNTDYGFNQYICYFDNSSGYGINKLIKSNLMPQSSKTGKYCFEIRICLNEKFLRVASLPQYSSIDQLDNPNKIDPKVAYLFFFVMQGQGNVMKITKFRTVSKFDDQM